MTNAGQQQKLVPVKIWVNQDELKALKKQGKTFSITPETYLHMVVFGNCWMPKPHVGIKKSGK